MGINESKQDLEQSLDKHIRLLKNSDIELEIKNSDLGKED